MSNKLSKKDIEAYNRLTILEGMQSVYFKGKVYTKETLQRIGELINNRKE
jgi:hypothetical protein